MNTMVITKYVGAICGSLLVFLLIVSASELIFDTHSEEVAFIIETPEAGGGEDDAPAEAVDVAALVAEADVDKGATVFKKCAACHKIDGTNGVGPHLDGVIGRDKGAVADAKYSGALQQVGGAWDPDALFHFLESPKGFAPGTSMSFAGLPKAEDRANVIAYLESLGN
jgi:cytochrome c